MDVVILVTNLNSLLKIASEIFKTGQSIYVLHGVLQVDTPIFTSIKLETLETRVRNPPNFWGRIRILKKNPAIRIAD